jgi:SAM-dependent methyltransferase
MSPGRTEAAAAAAAVIWHDVECGGFAADLELWRELAAASGGPVLDLGCGTGRVAVDLARNGHEVHALDLEPAFVAELERRAEAERLPIEAGVGDARDFDLDRRFGLVLAPMQLLQVLGGEEERVACLRAARRHLAPGAMLAAAIVDGFPDELVEEAPPPLPDTREVDGWIYSSLPLDATLDSGTITVRRLRQTVSPQGRLEEELDVVPLRIFDVETLEREARSACLAPTARRTVPPTDVHVGSTVVLMEDGT